MFMERRREVITFLPLLSSSTRARSRDGVDEEEGGGSGPNLVGGEGSGEDVGKVVSGDAGWLGNQVGSTKRPSNG